MYLKRGLLPPLMTVFDLSDLTLPCAQRDVTTVPTQALALLNNPFVHEQSLRLTTEIAHRYPPSERLAQIWQRVLGRLPSDFERRAAERYLKTQCAALDPVDTEQSAEPQPVEPSLVPRPVLLSEEV